MKPLLKSLLLYLLLFAAIHTNAQQASGASDTTRQLKMKGAYAMLRQVGNDGTKDSLMHSEQFKIYTDRYMMYVHPKAGDTLAEYGIGMYEIKNGKVMEYVFYNSETGERKDTFELNIFKMGNGYKQTIVFPDEQGGRWTLIEDYINVGRNTNTPLDGAWKQTKVTYIAPNGSKRTEDRPTQFKVYESGHFIWASTSVDAATKKRSSYYGYGSFQMDGNNKATEINTSSTFRADLIGQPVTLQLAFTGKDAYRQTITYPDGSKIVEEYKKLK